MKAAPKRLSTNKASPHYNLEEAKRVDKVFVDGVHIPNVVAYDVIQGWAMPKDLKTKSWLPKVHGEIKVTTKF